MCRILSYLGEPIVAEELLYKPDNSFIKQTYHPKYMSHLLNLAGFGLLAWDKFSHSHHLPFIYKTTHLPFYDDNLRNLSAKIKPACMLTHIRGVSYSSQNQVISEQNVHPFLYDNVGFAMAHNGSLFDFDKMKFDLLKHIKPVYQRQIRGTTDSEWIYALFLSQLGKFEHREKFEKVTAGVIETLRILRDVRLLHHIDINSPVNLFISDGEFLAATRFVFDYGWQSLDAHDAAHFTYHSLWYTFGERYGFYDDEYKMKGTGKKTSMIIASEPLTEDTTTWIEVPENTLIVATLGDGDIKIISHDINL